MIDPAARYGPRRRTARGYSSNLRPVLFFVALLIALLPIPVTAFELLPAYWIQARFLTFYAPVVCLLTLGYLFYVREQLARLLFADLLNPPQERYRYYPERFGQRLARISRRLRSVILAVLPLLLLGTSFWCFTRYTKRLSESVALATPVPVISPADPAASAVAGDSAQGYAPVQPSRSSQSSRDSTAVASGTAAKDSVPAPKAPPSREEVLRDTDIDRIPMFAELAAWYIGIFGTALVAVIVMALKEYAKEALGLSEAALVSGVSDEDIERDLDRM